jgi:hypothetical protein
MDFDAYVEDFNRNDERPMVKRWFTEDVVVEVPGRVLKGQAEWLAAVEASHAGGVRETLQPVAVLQEGDLILAEMDIQYVAAQGHPDFRLGPLEPGVPATYKYFAAYRLRDQRIAHLKLAFWPQRTS